MSKTDIFTIKDELSKEDLFKAQIIFKKNIFGTYNLVKNRSGIKPKYFVFR